MKWEFKENHPYGETVCNVWGVFARVWRCEVLFAVDMSLSLSCVVIHASKP